MTLPSSATPSSDLPARTGVHDAGDWWRQAVVYQIYPRSFADANGDGIGDLRGIISRVPYLAQLGIDAVWLSPFYPSDLADGGYDVADYRNVDPRIGTLEEFNEMVSALAAHDIRVIVDIVPNHSSDQHAAFQAALKAGPGSPERELYIFRDGRGEHGELPPADWTSAFGGPAWTRITEPDGAPGQWYLHMFAPEQPDWNWKHPQVREDFLHTLRFWADRGVAGFRVDVAHLLAKNLPEQLPSQAELDAMPKDGTHPMVDRDEVHEIYADWRAVFEEYDPPRTAVAEAWVEADRRPAYASPQGLGQAFNFDLLEADFDAAQFRQVVAFNLELAARSGSSSTWVFSNHDVVRHASRLALPARGADRSDKQGRAWVLSGGTDPVVDKAQGLRRAHAATLFELALPGSAYLYQGEELGLPEVVEIPDDERQDPTFFRSPGFDKGRDGCRVPLPWTTDGPSFGFGAGGAHLPQPTWFGDFAVERQENDAASTLALYRAALRLRRKFETDESLTWVEELSGPTTLAFVRPNGWLCLTNFGTEPVALPDGELLIATQPVTGGMLPGEATAWLAVSAPEGD